MPLSPHPAPLAISTAATQKRPETRSAGWKAGVRAFPTRNAPAPYPAHGRTAPPAPPSEIPRGPALRPRPHTGRRAERLSETPGVLPRGPEGPGDGRQLRRARPQGGRASGHPARGSRGRAPRVKVPPPSSRDARPVHSPGPPRTQPRTHFRLAVAVTSLSRADRWPMESARGAWAGSEAACGRGLGGLRGNAGAGPGRPPGDPRDPPALCVCPPHASRSPRGGRTRPCTAHLCAQVSSVRRDC